MALRPLEPKYDLVLVLERRALADHALTEMAPSVLVASNGGTFASDLLRVLEETGRSL